MDFKLKTERLKEELILLKERFLTNEKPENKRDYEFFSYVKDKTTPIFLLIDEWEQSANELIQKREISIHPQQVASTKDNFELLLLHSYYIDVKKKRYMELYQAIQYVFDLALVGLKKNT